MNPGVLLALLAAAAAFVLATGDDLPPIVASHFDGSGAANGFTTRRAYLAVMLLMVTGIPTVMVMMARFLHRLSPRYINVPYRDYWLAPGRREATLAYMAAYLASFAWVLVLFLCFVHWRVVEANRLQPPHLSPAWFVPALVAFVVVAGFWMVALYRRFPRPPPQSPA